MSAQPALPERTVSKTLCSKRRLWFCKAISLHGHVGEVKQEAKDATESRWGHSGTASSYHGLCKGRQSLNFSVPQHSLL